jgi:hypothetical protein
MPFENRTAQTRTATTMEPTSASHSVYGAVSGISFPNDSRIAAPTSTLSLPSPYPARLVCEEKLGQLWSMGTRTSKKSSSVAFQSHAWLGAPPPLERCQAPPACAEHAMRNLRPFTRRCPHAWRCLRQMAVPLRKCSQPIIPTVSRPSSTWALLDARDSNAEIVGGGTPAERRECRQHRWRAQHHRCGTRSCQAHTWVSRSLTGGYYSRGTERPEKSADKFKSRAARGQQ